MPQGFTESVTEENSWRETVDNLKNLVSTMVY